MNMHFDGAPETGGDFDYPRGWFVVCLSDEVNNETPTPLHFFGTKYLAFRNTKNEVVILDGLCPHMGSEIAVGGVVDGDGVRCPFHFWHYDETGKCDDIPYAKRIPPQAKLNQYPAAEKNGLIFMWHDPLAGEPDYEIPDIAEWNEPNWIKWSPVTFTVKTHAREIIDNIADKAHFDPVHGSIVETFDVSFDGHTATQVQSGGHKTLAMEGGGKLHTSATYHGPGYLLTDMTGMMGSKMLVAHTPITVEGNGEVRVWYGLMVDTMGVDTPEMKEGAAMFTESGREAFWQDVAIWEAKATINKPLLCDGDGPIMKAREWYAQFYNPRPDQEQKAAAE
ncbi:MAG: Rieske 2Fe-2S domain-containing protein [Alphaproteobacteria bacterium]